jgi:hypothetical protein
MSDQTNIKTRNPKLICAIGRKGIGKSWQTIRLINHYVLGNPSKGIKPRRCLIYDVNNEFTQYKTLAVEDVKKFCFQTTIEARRITIYKKDGSAKGLDEIASDLAIVMENFRGGLLLIEDLTKFVGDSFSTDIIGKLCTLRHVDTDVYIHFQGVGKLGHPKILMNCNVCRLHLFEDSVERHKNKFNEKTEILKIGEAVVNNSGEIGQKMIREIKKKYPDKWRTDPKLVKQLKDIENKYIRIFVYVDFDDRVIKGAFSESEFREAIFTYIKMNKSETLGKRINEIDRSGKKVHTSASAIKATEDELFELYFGN